MSEVASLGQVKSVPVKAIQPAERNPRKIPPAAVRILAKSLERFGWQQPLVVDKDNVLVAGHTRLLAAKELGLESVPVVVAESLTPAEIDAYRIADNRTHDFTSWDFPELIAQLDELSDDFSDVLALADWEALVDDFNDLNLDIPDDAKVDMAGKGFTVSVIFADKKSALEAEQGLLDLPGVLDVRHARQ